LPEKKFHILVAPLDWGIGHATRCVPIIRMLQSKGAVVTIAAAGRPLDFLKGIFPDVRFAEAPGFRVTYPSTGSMALKMAWSAPRLLAGILHEHRWLERYISEHGVDAVISDNRFGFWSRYVPSIYLTHQVLIRMPKGMAFLEVLSYRAHGLFIKKYSECWIPDFEGEKNLSGDLSHRYARPANAFFIGPLSRFINVAGETNKETMVPGPDLLVMLSGPEPQRSILEKIILAEVERNPGLTTVILRGIPGEENDGEPKAGLMVHSHLSDREIAELIRTSRHIVCRPGYSTIMDLASMGRTAILVPTPGQTEQEYLAGYLSCEYGFCTITQKNFSLEEALNAPSSHNPAFTGPITETVLEARISRLLMSLENL
jgi:hypothetical protein